MGGTGLDIFRSHKQKAMKKFLVTYHTPVSVMEQMGEPTPEEMEKGMEPWMAWAAKCGDQLVDLGCPLMGGEKILPGGGVEPSTRQVTGYSFLQAGSLEEAKALLDGHPHLSWNAECEIEIHECMPLPG